MLIEDVFMCIPKIVGLFSCQYCHPKGGLISESFYFGSNHQKKMVEITLLSTIHVKKAQVSDSDLATSFENLSQNEKLSGIKPHLKVR